MTELQPFERNDFRRLIQWVPSAEFLMQWAGFIFTYPLNERQLEEYLQFPEMNPSRRRIWRVIETGTGTVIGHVELNNIYDHDRKADLCRVLIGPPWRGKGFGKQMVMKVLEYGFETLGLHRIQLGVFDFNISAIRCYEGCGFSLRKGFYANAAEWAISGGAFIRLSDYQMSILDHEWRARKDHSDCPRSSRQSD